MSHEARDHTWKPRREKSWFARTKPGENRLPIGSLLSTFKPEPESAFAFDHLEDGLFGDVKPVGEGVSELRLDFGPGYRVYFGQKGLQIHLLLGGSKHGQNANIRLAKKFWRAHDNED